MSSETANTPVQHDPQLDIAGRCLQFVALMRHARGLLLVITSAAIASRVAFAQLAHEAAGTTRPNTTAPVPARQAQFERPFLWKIDRDPPAFLFGTIHLADDRILDVPAVVQAALESSDALVTEIPMDMQTMVNEMGPRMLLPEGQTLAKVLPKPLYERVGKYLADHGQPMHSMERCKVWVLAAQIGLIDLVKEVGANEGLDQRLARQARSLGKETGGLETIGEQLAALDGLTPEEQIRSLDKTLAKLEENASKGRKMGRELLDRYFEGDEIRLVKLMAEWLDADDPLEAKNYDLLITQRDRRMAERIDLRLRQMPDQSCMFAIGAYHLIGSKANVIDQLAAKGWKIRRLFAKDAADLRAELAKIRPNAWPVAAETQPARK